MLKVLASVLLAVAQFGQAQSSADVARWKSDAERGNAHAQFWLGAAYESGRGIKRDFTEAFRWASKSAKQGNADAQNLLGRMYEDGEGVAQDYARAAWWYRAACEHRPDYGGAGQGCNNLGLMYLEGRGVKVKKIEAYKYFKVSGSANLASVISEMTPREIAEAERQAEQWLRAHPDK